MTEEGTILDRLHELMEKIQSLHDAYIEEARAKEQQKLRECLTALRQIGREIDDIVNRL